MSRLSILVFSALFCLAWGWEPGTQYVYDYTGRSLNGIYYMKQQYAIIEIRSRVIVQSHDENTIVVKLTDGRVKRNGKFEHNPYFNGEINEMEINPSFWDEIEGHEDPITNPEYFGAPFVINHNKGSFVSLKIGADEPLWVVNYKKGIASQLQLDISGVRPDGEPIDWSVASQDESGVTFTVFEDSISGDCSSTISISPMSMSKLYQHETSDLKSFDELCKDKPIYEIVKTKDFNRCKTTPVSYYAQPATYMCSLDKANCADSLMRHAHYRYIGCGSLPKLTYLSLNTLSDLIIKPFAMKTDELVNSDVLRWILEKKESISSRFSSPPNAKEYKTLSQVFPEFEQDENPTDSTFIQPSLEDAYLKSPIPLPKLQQTVYETLRFVAKDLKDKPDSESDMLGRLSVIGRTLPMFSLDQLRSLWQQIKKEDPLAVSLFVDSVVQSGSNPAIMLIKDVIVNKEISEQKSIWAAAALGYFAKTPTTELLHELVNLYKSGTVQSSKDLKQTTLMTIADLFHAACGDIISAKRFAPQLGDLCDKKDPVVINEFLPLLVKELETSESPADRIVTLTAFGSFGFEEIIPILLPYIRGSGRFDDTAERTRAILSLNRVVYLAPEKVHPILYSLASNFEERPEVRMAAIGLLFSSNAPLAMWQKLAAISWFERSNQVASFVHTLSKSITQLPEVSPFNQELVEKAKHAQTMAKRFPYGLPYSFFAINTTYMDQEGMGTTMDSVSYRVADEKWPVFFSNSHVYNFGPFVSRALTVFVWNYNMGEVWQNIFEKLYGNMRATGSPRSGFARTGLNSGNNLKSIWEELDVAHRPSDKRVGLIHLNLMGSVNRFFDLEKLPGILPGLMSEFIKAQSTNNPFEVDFTKYRMLGDYDIKFPSEMGLPVRFMAKVPILLSAQGTLKPDGRNGLKSDVAFELDWKQSSELRTELPFNGNYIATGVDVRVDNRLPKEMYFSYHNGQMKVTWTPGTKVTDLFYFHVKPYTATRNVADSYKPIVEDEKAYHLISVNDKPIESDVSLGERYGVNLRWLSHSEFDFSDYATWWQWLKKWDIHSFTALGFAPFDLRYRKYVIRYKPEGSKARSVQTWLQYQYATKSCEHTNVFETGNDKPTKSSPNDILSSYPIAAEFQPTLDRVFKNVESGKAHLLRAGFTIEQRDGTFIHFNGTLGVSKDAWNTKDFTDLRIEKYTTTGPSVTANKKYDYAVCLNGVRNWNNPPSYGFSKDVLYLTDDETIGFGEHCDQSKIRVKAKVYRDEYAAKRAMYSPVGRKCQKDISEGFMYGSPACEQARILDHTYNNYELSAESENLPAPFAKWINGLRRWIDHAVYEHTVEHTYQSNAPNRAILNIKYDPYTFTSNMTWVRPTETVVAHNIPWIGLERFTPVTNAFVKQLFPLNAEKNWPRRAANVTSGGITENKCYVGPKNVFTYDGAYYNYTLDGCQHVLLTDCSRKSELAVLAHQEGQYKVVQVVYDKDTIELHPMGYVTINGAKTSVKSIDKDSRFEIRDPATKSIKAVILPIQDGLLLEIKSHNLFVKVQGTHIELTAPYHLRGRTCGLCGDYNQETYGEFKTPSRCVLSAGELMASSFKLSTGQSCSPKKDDLISRRLTEETEKCKSYDKYYSTHLPEVDLKKPTKCTRYEKLTHVSPYEKMSCESVEYSAECQPGCKPFFFVSKPFTFKCSGNKDMTLVKKVTVPTACVSA